MLDASPVILPQKASAVQEVRWLQVRPRGSRDRPPDREPERGSLVNTMYTPCPQVVHTLWISLAKGSRPGTGPGPGPRMSGVAGRHGGADRDPGGCTPQFPRTAGGGPQGAPADQRGSGPTEGHPRLRPREHRTP